jgi:hypothetical protein
MDSPQNRIPETALTGRPRRRRAWIWFFVTLAVLTVFLIGVQIWYRWSHQLTLAQLEQAQNLWQQQGPRDYDMEETVKRGDSSDVFAVKVRGGRVVALSLNGQPAPERLYRYHTMPALFGFIREFLEPANPDPEASKRRVYMAGSFDPKDGHLNHFVRSVSGTRERVEITVEFHAVDNTAGSALGSDPHWITDA